MSMQTPSLCLAVTAFTLSPLAIDAAGPSKNHLSAGVFGHPDHGASFLEQLIGQWVFGVEGEGGKRLRFYEDGRFGCKVDGQWTAGSYVILRSDERSKGVLRLEYYVDGNLHLQEVRCEVYFTEEDEHGGEGAHDHGSESEEEHHHGHHHEHLKVEVLPAAEQALGMAGDYLHQH